MGDPLYPWDRKQESQQDEREAGLRSQLADLGVYVLEKNDGTFDISIPKQADLKQLLWDAAKAIQWHLEPNSPDEHESLMKRLYAAAQQVQADAGAVAIYQCMCPDDNDPNRPDAGEVWMDLLPEAYEYLSKRPDVRSRIVYLRPAAESDKRADAVAAGNQPPVEDLHLRHVQAAQRVFEDWFSDLGLDITASESERIAVKVIEAVTETREQLATRLIAEVVAEGKSPTAGMTLAERIDHVGGRTNAQGYIEFGSPMAVDALIKHALRDHAANTTPDVPDHHPAPLDLTDLTVEFGSDDDRTVWVSFDDDPDDRLTDALMDRISDIEDMPHFETADYDMGGILITFASHDDAEKGYHAFVNAKEANNG